MTAARRLCLILLCLAGFAATAPMAHVLELPNKLGLDGVSWLMVQQQLYRGWGAVFGPVEIAGLVLSAALAFLVRKDGNSLALAAAAAAIYAAMIVVFFVFNAPVNTAFAAWTPQTLPPDWAHYRNKWETGHALAAALSVLALFLIARTYLRLSRQ